MVKPDKKRSNELMTSVSDSGPDDRSPPTRSRCPSSVDKLPDPETLCPEMNRLGFSPELSFFNILDSPTALFVFFALLQLSISNG